MPRFLLTAGMTVLCSIPNGVPSSGTVSIIRFRFTGKGEVGSGTLTRTGKEALWLNVIGRYFAIMRSWI